MAVLIALMMEAAGIYETSVNYYQTTRRNNPEDSHLHNVSLFLRSDSWLGEKMVGLF
jgi:hypothetical protein